MLINCSQPGIEMAKKWEMYLVFTFGRKWGMKRSQTYLELGKEKTKQRGRCTQVSPGCGMWENPKCGGDNVQGVSQSLELVVRNCAPLSLEGNHCRIHSLADWSHSQILGFRLKAQPMEVTWVLRAPAIYRISDNNLEDREAREEGDQCFSVTGDCRSLD